MQLEQGGVPSTTLREVSVLQSLNESIHIVRCEKVCIISLSKPSNFAMHRKTFICCFKENVPPFCIGLTAVQAFGRGAHQRTGEIRAVHGDPLATGLLFSSDARPAPSTQQTNGRFPRWCRRSNISPWTSRNSWKTNGNTSCCHWNS